MSPATRQPMMFDFFATAPKGLSDLLAAELTALGAEVTGERAGAVRFSGPLESAYRLCLWSRVASRVLLVLGRGPAADATALYESARTVDWSAHLAPGATLAVDFSGRSAAITHSQFGAQRVKDAIVDELRQRRGARPDVDLAAPDVRINAYLEHDVVQLAVDLSGEALHRRGYRAGSVAAPLKENLAAAILLRAGWPAIAAAGGPLVDLMCGSGTLPIEAALMAGEVAPGLLRGRHGFERWPGHDPAAWSRLLEEAAERREAGLRRLPDIRGYDADAGAVRAGLANLEAAGLRGRVHLERRELGDPRSAAAAGSPPGLVVANPPYGQRLGEQAALTGLYELLGSALREGYAGWEAAVLTGAPALGRHLGIRARRSHTLWNGAIECRLLRFTLSPEWLPAPRLHPVERARARVMADGVPTAGAGMVANRLRKNLRELGRWAAREGIACWRLYDADMPEYAVAIDLYHDREARRWVHVQEYRAPASVDPERARHRLEELLAVLPEVLEVPPERVVLKRRERQRGTAQYERRDERGGFIEVAEGPARLLVNLTDYLDTGLFLDHRPTRLMLGRLAAGGRFLNLFCYTAAATVHAGLGGALQSTSVDMSATYLDWARRNLALNALAPERHRLVRADCLQWLREGQSARERYDLVFLDPPTFSNSARMQGVLDIQRDHGELIQAAAALLAPGGTLVFSTNHRRFRLERDALSALAVEDLGATSLPRDFARNPRIHRCWRITRAA